MNIALETKICGKCGGVRIARNCRACNLESVKRYQKNNREKVKAVRALWRKLNPEKAKEKDAKCKIRNAKKNRETRARYRATNPEKVKASTERWRAKNAERFKAVAEKYRAENQEKRRAAVAKWDAAHPEIRRIHSQNRRARKLKNGGKLSKGIAEKLFKLQKGKCPCCGESLGKDFQLDHIIPLAANGANTDDNVQLLRKICNQNKKSKHSVDFMQSRGFLL